MFAVAGYFFTLWATPRVVLLTLKTRSKGVLNEPWYNDIITAKDRFVALPNPDFLYVAMGYDVSSNDLLITSKLPDTSYYSISFYDTDTRNYFIRNDKDIDEEGYKLLLTSGDRQMEGYQSVKARSKRGFILVRILVTDAERAEYLKEIQHSFKVEQVES